MSEGICPKGGGEFPGENVLHSNHETRDRTMEGRTFVGYKREHVKRHVLTIQLKALSSNLVTFTWDARLLYCVTCSSVFVRHSTFLRLEVNLVFLNGFVVVS